MRGAHGRPPPSSSRDSAFCRLIAVDPYPRHSVEPNVKSVVISPSALTVVLSQDGHQLKGISETGAQYRILAFSHGLATFAGPVGVFISPVGAGTNDTHTTIERHEALAELDGVRASLAVVPY